MGAPDRSSCVLVSNRNIEPYFIEHIYDSIEDYPEITSSALWNPPIEAYRISIVGPTRAFSCNSSSRYPTIRGSESSDACTPSNIVVQNLNPDFNVVWL
jgi:hypothetical protein